MRHPQNEPGSDRDADGGPIADVGRAQEVSAFTREEITAVAATPPRLEEAAKDLSFQTDKTTQPDDTKNEIPKGKGH